VTAYTPLILKRHYQKSPGKVPRLRELRLQRFA
jgi:hypothetical protein